MQKGQTFVTGRARKGRSGKSFWQAMKEEGTQQQGK